MTKRQQTNAQIRGTVHYTSGQFASELQQWVHQRAEEVIVVKGFKDFIMRGNVIDLAVAVVIGAAFTAIVNALVESVFNPALGALFNAENLDKAWIVGIPTLSGGEAQIMLGTVATAVIQFVLVAAAVYFALATPTAGHHSTESHSTE